MKRFIRVMILRRLIAGALFGAVLVGTTTEARCEETPRQSHNVFIELFGASDFVSVNYDTRFRGQSVFGWRAGLGFSAIQCDNITVDDALRAGISLPLGLNAIVGKRASKFEVGVHVSPGLYFYRDKEYHHDMNSSRTEEYGPNHKLFGCSFGLDAGYRLQRRDGFSFRIGLSPTIDVTKDNTVFHLLSLIPYLSFGYTFR